MAKRYTMPASVREAMKYGPPRSPKFREQIVNTKHNVAPSPYTMHSGLTFTILSCLSVIAPPQAPTL
jgi:hypothetical protein